MTDHDLALIQRHMRGALLGEPTPSLRGTGVAPLLEALGSPLRTSLPVAARNAALARIGLMTLDLLRERTMAGLHAERELSMLGRRDRS